MSKIERPTVNDANSRPGLAGQSAARTLPALLSHQAARDPAHELFVCADQRWSIADTLALAAAMAASLAGAGVRRGDRVALFCGNRPEFLRVFLGCAWMGAVAVPINTACRGPQLQYYLANSGARLLAIEASLLVELAAVPADGLALERVWVIGEAAGAAMDSPAFSTEPLPHTTERHDAAALDPGDTLAILYTSGTTGPSKGVCCPHAQLHAWGANTARLLSVVPGDVLCTTLPLFHVNALNGFYQALIVGATQVIEPRFSVSGFWSAMAGHRATVGYLLGAMIPMLLAREPSPEERAHTLRIALGPGVPPALRDAFRERTGVHLLEGYGSTETNFVIAVPPGEDARGTMGRLQPGFAARVVDEQDNPLPPGQAGELVLRADEPFVFNTGYFGMAEQTVQAWRNLWFHTGDRVVCDDEGRYRFIDRLKDAIRRRGENIASFEVEQVLLSHPDIESVAVFPVGSELAEDEVMAAIVLKAGRAPDPVALMRFCETRLAHFAVPRFIDFVPELPRTENGKVRKVALRERGRSAGTWDREAAGVVIARRR